MIRRTRAPLAPLAALALAACGDVPPPLYPPLTVVDDAQQTGTWTTETATPLSGAVSAIGRSAAHHLVLVLDAQAQVDVRGALEARPVYAEAGEPMSLGEAHTVRPRAAEGAWIAGPAGLFALDAHFVTRSPLSDGLRDVRDVAEIATGPLAGVWIVDAEGLRWARDGRLDEVALALEDPRHLAIEPTGAFGLVASEAQVVLLEPADGGLEATVVDLAFGAVRALGAADGAAYVAGDNGLFTTDGARWTYYPLGGAELDALAIDPSTGAAWAKAGAVVFRVVDDEPVTRFGIGADERHLVVDQLGDVHAVASGALFSRGTGANRDGVTTFADVKPWLAAHCSQCHRNQTADFEQYDVFIERAEDALARVRAGDMPRCAGSVRCPEAMTLSPDDYAVLEQWIRDGMPE